MDQFRCDAVVIGAGAVGLAIARELAMAGRETIILEKNAQIGMETSARNSEVIHSGLYYPQGSLKARLCVEGRDSLYKFCQRHGVPYARIGKLIVATQDQEADLAAIATAAAANGVDEVQPLSRAQILTLEPELQATNGLFSPSTGIIDSHAYMLALLGDAQGAGGNLALNAKVTAITRSGNEWSVAVRSDDQTMQLNCGILVNSAGLWASRVAAQIEALKASDVPFIHLAKGSYVTLSGRSPFKHLIYPLPEPGGLGVHLTLDMGGGARFGPDVEWLVDNDPSKIDYAVPLTAPERFAPVIQTYWPSLDPARLTPGYAGVRPKLSGRGEPNSDFRIDGPQKHGLDGLVNLFGIESPGLTSSLAIARRVAALLT